MPLLDEVFSRLKSIDLRRGAATFYVVKRHLVNREARYKVMRVRTDDPMRDKLRGVITGSIADALRIREYEFVSTDIEEASDLMGLPINESDVGIIISALTSDQEIEVIKDPKNLIGSIMYVVRLDVDDYKVFAFRSVSSQWNTRNASPWYSAIWQDEKLVGLDTEEIFRVDKKIDFVSFEDFTFIFDKAKFEFATNFRVGMERKRDDLVRELVDTAIISASEHLLEYVGNHMGRLKKLAEINNSGYFRREDFLRILRDVSDRRGWEVPFTEDGKILIVVGKEDLVLRVLNDGILASELTRIEYNVDAKHPRAGN